MTAVTETAWQHGRDHHIIRVRQSLAPAVKLHMRAHELLDSEEFQMMVLCCLPSIAVMKVDQRPNVAVEYDRPELLELLRENFPPMRAPRLQGTVRSSCSL